MRPVRTLIIGVLALTSAIAIALPSLNAAADAASSVHYVALGDSYSSGTGTGSESGSCEQSSQAYGPLWAAANSPASFTFGACGGATTSSVISGQLSDLNSSTTLVSLTIGGNDAGFASIMETCVLQSDSACASAVSKGEAYAQNTLPGNLKTMFADIHADAPNARVILLSYPHFYDMSVAVCIGLDKTKHTDLNNGVDVLDSVLQTAAAADGATFADARGQFSGHELCSGDNWLHSVDLANISESYHPTATGHKDGYLPVFSSAASSVGQ
ncbi:MAG: SGNH/GDSL hydrolase family protein [Streptosporangiales bacterium]|nr:SGNH/GDSL hydrolase family protein [Streptosporangiales bacterium]